MPTPTQPPAPQNLPPCPKGYEIWSPYKGARKPLNYICRQHNSQTWIAGSSPGAYFDPLTDEGYIYAVPTPPAPDRSGDDAIQPTIPASAESGTASNEGVFDSKGLVIPQPLNVVPPPASELPLTREKIEVINKRISDWLNRVDLVLPGILGDIGNLFTQALAAIELREQRNDARHWLGVEVEKNNQLLKWQRALEARALKAEESIKEFGELLALSRRTIEIKEAVNQREAAPAPTAVLVEREELIGLLTRMIGESNRRLDHLSVQTSDWECNGEAQKLIDGLRTPPPTKGEK